MTKASEIPTPPGPQLVKICPLCKTDGVIVDPSSLKIQSLTSEGSTWTTKGKGKLVICGHGMCANCGALVRQITHTVPIALQLRCPECNETGGLKPRVSIKSFRDFEAEFVCEVACLQCRTKSNFKQFFSTLAKMVTLKFGPATLAKKKDEEEEEE